MNDAPHTPRPSLLALSCAEASRLASEGFDRDLTRRERWALRIHMWLCHGCRRFARQICAIRETLRAMPEGWRTQWRDQAAKLSPERRDAIKRLLADAAHPDA